LKDFAVIISSFGEDHYTDQVLEDLSRQNYAHDVMVVDGKGDYFAPVVSGDSIDDFRIVKSEFNPGWLRATNLGTGLMDEHRYDAFIWLNNDVRLSPLFLAGLDDALTASGGLCGLLAPCYDDVWPQQLSVYEGAAGGYVPLPSERVVKFIDNACMVVPEATWRSVGPMDERFASYGWGAEFDYSIRVRQKNQLVIVTERSFFNHFGGGTAKKVEENYEGPAGEEMHNGMLDKYGPGWEDMLR
jgi:GT2 family glycosyltransferase